MGFANEWGITDAIHCSIMLFDKSSGILAYQVTDAPYYNYCIIIFFMRTQC